MMVLSKFKQYQSYKRMAVLDSTFVMNTAPLYKRLRYAKKWEYQFKKVTFKEILPNTTPGSLSSGSFKKFSNGLRITLGVWDETPAFPFSIDAKSYKLKGQSSPTSLEACRIFAEIWLSIDATGEQIKVSHIQNGIERKNPVLIGTEDQRWLEVIEQPQPAIKASPALGDVVIGTDVDVSMAIPTLPSGVLQLLDTEMAAILGEETLPPSHTALVKSIAKGVPLNPTLQLSFQISKQLSSKFGVVLGNIRIKEDLFSSIGVQYSWFQDGEERGSMSLLMQGTGEPAGLALPIETCVDAGAWLNYKQLQLSFLDLMQHGQPGPSTTGRTAILFSAPGSFGGTDDGYDHHNSKEAVEYFVRHVALKLLAQTVVGQQEVLPILTRYGVEIVGVWDKASGIVARDGLFDLIIDLNEYEKIYRKEYESGPEMLGGKLPGNTTVHGRAVLDIVYWTTLLAYYDKPGQIPQSMLEKVHAAALENKKRMLEELRQLSSELIGPLWEFDGITVDDK